jgi:hypothetical protein
MNDDERGTWLGMTAVAWVIDHAPVPVELAWTLVVIARRAGDSGRNSYQSIATIAAKTGKSEKQARRDVQRLKDLGLIVLGDQTLVEHLPAGQRPVVYDLPLHLRGPKPNRESRNPTGMKAGDTPPMDGSPPLDGTPPMDGLGTPPMHGMSTPPMHGRQRDPLKNPVEEPSLLALTASGAGTERAEDLPAKNNTTARRILAAHGCTGPAANHVIAHYPGKGAGWWRAVDKAGDVPDRIADAQAPADQPPVDADRARAAFIATLRDQPPCEHQIPGGHLPQPVTGWVACVAERRRHRPAG